MASSHNLLWVALLVTLTASYVVLSAPTGALQMPEEDVAPEEVGKVDEETIKMIDGGKGIEKALEEEEIDEEGLPAKDQPEALEEEDKEERIVGDTVDDGQDSQEVVEEFKDEVMDDGMDLDDVVTGSSSQPDATDYLWEPSFNYDSLGASDVNPWFLYDLPDDPTQWSSNFDIFDEEYYPYVESSYESVSEGDGEDEPEDETEDETDNLDNSLETDAAKDVFDGVPMEELNNKVDQTVDEFLCMLGLCNDARVYPEEDDWDKPNEVQFTEEGMMGDNQDKEESESQEKAADSSTGVEAEDDESSSRPKQDVSVPAESTKHRSKRDLTWDQQERDAELLDKINALEDLAEEEETHQGEPVMTAAEQFEDLLQFFKEEAAENKRRGEEFLVGIPADLIPLDGNTEEFQDALGGEGGEDGYEEGPFGETGEFVDEDESEDEVDKNWGPYLESPYVKDTLKYDGYKRDDEREALKVYIESLQNLEGYRKRSDQGDLEDDGHLTTDFLRKLVPRSPPNSVRYPKTGLEPFSREKYFPLFPGSEGMADDDSLTYPDEEIVLQKYNELMDLINTEIEAAALISTIEDMAAEISKDQQLLDELEQEEEVMFGDDNTGGMLDLIGTGNTHPMKRAQRTIDYQDFNEYPLKFHRSVPAFRDDELSNEELMKLFSKYVSGDPEEAEWGDFMYDPRERREGEDSLPGPYGAYYVQGRMINRLMKPKRSSEDNELEDVLAGESDDPYVLVEPADLGYDEWPGDFEVFYDTRDGTFVMDPEPQEPQDTRLISDEALLDALGLLERTFVGDEEVEEEEEEETQDGGNWGAFKDDDQVLQNDLEKINEDLDKLEELYQLVDIAEVLQIGEDKALEEANLLEALLGE